MERVFLILIFLGFGVTLSTQKARFHAEFTQQKCFIDEIESLINIDYCSELDVSDNTVRHQGVCTAKNGKVVYTCQHGHWSETDSSVASLHRKKRFFRRLFRAVYCFFFCKRGGGGGGTTIKYPPSFPDPCKPNDIQSNYNIDAGDDSVVVRWTVPKASDRDGGTPRLHIYFFIM
ncbi:uncharacterized protein LOC132722341, partial [Ruditapes philippinarum]|uniref:uncharacterized protein LOC132722341 n=1 Tax=Ruditapes philippinarum TaxID=129788 RepID=UPI00295A8139